MEPSLQPPPPRVGFLHVRQIHCLAPEHEHDEAQVTIPLSGDAMTLRWHDDAARTRSRPLHRDVACIIPPGQPHRFNWRGPGEILNLYLSADLLEHLRQERTSNLRATLADQPFCTNPLLREAIKSLRLDNLRFGTVDPPVVEAVGILVAAQLLRQGAPDPTAAHRGLLPRARLLPAIERIEDAPQDAVTLHELAALCQASVYHFARSFTAVTGLSPLAYQRRVRIERAQNLLLSTRLSIQQIGARVGIFHANSFSRLFRDETGMTPSLFRQQHARRN